jgi:hypothetical protein
LSKIKGVVASQRPFRVIFDWKISTFTQKSAGVIDSGRAGRVPVQTESAHST